VLGFVNNETQDVATTGALRWITSATNASNAGRYAINGSGLSAANYSFSQAATNPTALTLKKSVSRVPVMSDIVFKASLGQASRMAAQASQTTQAINTLPSTGAGQTASGAGGSAPDSSANPVESLGASGLIYMTTDNLSLPEGATRTTADNLTQRL
jgi:hypothetical protein